MELKGLCFLIDEFIEHEKLKRAIEGGVSIVRLRVERWTKISQETLDRVQKLREICKTHNVKFIVEENIELTILVKADGVIEGYKDITIKKSKAKIGEMILGVSVKTNDDAESAILDGADFICINNILESTEFEVPPLGLSTIVEDARNAKQDAKGCFGGVQMVAVDSEISDSEDPFVAALELSRIVKMFDEKKPPLTFQQTLKYGFEKLKTSKPVVHQITNPVVMNFCANVALAAGGSTIMSVSSVILNL